jgi:hypothetical protein
MYTWLVCDVSTDKLRVYRVNLLHRTICSDHTAHSVPFIR